MKLCFLNVGTSEIFLGLFIIPFILVVYTIYHIIKNKNLSTDRRILWLIVVFLFNFIGNIIYDYYVLWKCSKIYS